MRERFLNNDLTEVERPSGTLKEYEIEEICQAYRDGCRGEILIGLRGEERVITMLLPAQTEKLAMENLLAQSIAKLREIGCDRYLRVENGLAK